MTRELYEACCALLDAPHPDHFATRLGDAENDALNRIKVAVAAIKLSKLDTKCDGNHGGPPCGDRECWAREAPSVETVSYPAAALLRQVANDLTIQEIIAANMSRVERWHSLADWSPLEWSGAMGGEVGELSSEVLAYIALRIGKAAGEAANYSKKFKRIETEIANNDKRMFGLDVPKEQLLETYREGIGMETADVFIYGVLLCARVNVDLVKCIRKAFNLKSIEYGFPERL